MDFRSSEHGRGAARARTCCRQTAAAAVKVVIVGGFGVGKTTLVGSVSEIRPLTTEETMTQAGVGVDDTAGRGAQDLDHRRHGLRPHQHQRGAGALPVRHARPGALLVPVERPVRGRARARSCWSTPAGWRSASTSSAGWRSAACPSSSPSTPSPDAPELPARGAARRPRPARRRPDRRLRRPAARLQPRRPADAHALPALPRRDPGGIVSTTPPHRPGCPAHAAAASAGLHRLYGPEAEADPTGLYEKLRAEHGAVAPVLVHGDLPAWLVLGHRENLDVARTPSRFSRDSAPLARRAGGQGPGRPPAAPDGRLAAGVQLRRRRGARAAARRGHRVPGALRPARHPPLRHPLRRPADRRLRRRADRPIWSTEFAEQLPMLVMTQLFGMPEEYGPRLVEAARDMIKGTETAAREQRVRHRRAAASSWSASAPRPARDLASWLLEHPAELTRRRGRSSTCGVVLIAAYETTANLIANTLRMVLTDPRFRANLSGGHMTLPDALEQVLWDEPPITTILGPLGHRRHRARRPADQGRRHAAARPGRGQRRPGDPARPVARPCTATARTWRSAAARTSAPGQDIGRAIADTGIDILLARLPDLRAGRRPRTSCSATALADVPPPAVAAGPVHPAAAARSRGSTPSCPGHPAQPLSRARPRRPRPCPPPCAARSGRRTGALAGGPRLRGRRAEALSVAQSSSCCHHQARAGTGGGSTLGSLGVSRPGDRRTKRPRREVRAGCADWRSAAPGSATRWQPGDAVPQRGEIAARAARRRPCASCCAAAGRTGSSPGPAGRTAAGTRLGGRAALVPGEHVDQVLLPAAPGGRPCCTRTGRCRSADDEPGRVGQRLDAARSTALRRHVGSRSPTSHQVSEKRVPFDQRPASRRSRSGPA